MMKKLIWLGVASVALFAVTATVRAQDVGFENIFGGDVSVDLKVNGQDGPVKVDRGERIVVSWVSDGATRCRGNWSRNDIKTSGTIPGKISKSVIVKVACINGQGDRDDDSVVVNVSGGAVIPTIPSPTSASCPAVVIRGYSVPTQINGSTATVNISNQVANGTRYASTTFTCYNGTFMAGPETADIVCDKGYTSVGIQCVTKTTSAQPTITLTSGVVPATRAEDNYIQYNAAISGAPAGSYVMLKVSCLPGVTATFGGGDRCNQEVMMNKFSASIYALVLQFRNGFANTQLIGAVARLYDVDGRVLISDKDVFNLASAAPTTTAQLTIVLPAISVNLKANGSDGPLTVSAGTSVGLSYTTTGKIAECKGDVSGYDTGSTSVTANATKTYTVTCSQDGGTGSATDSVTVNITQPTTTTTTTPTPTGGTPTITVTGPLNSYGAPGIGFVTFESKNVSRVKIEACVNKTDCTVISSETAVSGSPLNVRWDLNGTEPFVGAMGTKPIYIKVTDLVSGVYDFADSYMYVTPPTSGAAGSSFAGAGVPDSDVWSFLKAFFGR